jgi:ribose transport system permease protein
MPSRTRRWQTRIGRNRGLLIAVIVFVLLLVLNDRMSAYGIGYADLANLLNGSMPLILAALGQTLIIVAGGFDLSSGTVVSLVNVLLASQMQAAPGSEWLWAFAGIGVGGAVGLVNGFFVAWFRLPSTVVTLASMFVVQGLTLLVMATPGGQIPTDFSALVMGDAIPNLVPFSGVLLAIALLVWGGLRNSRFGTALFAVGSDSAAAAANGVNVRVTLLLTYFAAGCFYGAAGVFVSGQIGSGDPLVGDAMLLQVFAAVVVGGTALGGGRGTALGTVFGALILMTTVNTLLTLDVSTYFGTIVEGVILLAAVIGNTMSRRSTFARQVEQLQRRFIGWRSRTLPSAMPRPQPAPRLVDSNVEPRADPTAGMWWPQRMFDRYGPTLRLVLPSYFIFILVVIATLATFGAGAVLSVNYFSQLLVLSGLLAVLALGQGAVVLTGGFDISMPWTISLCAIVFAHVVSGSDLASLWVLPAVLLLGAVIGLFNGFGVAVFGVAPIVMTLATNGILQGITLLYTDGRPTGWVSPWLQWLMTGRVFGVAPFVVFLVFFVAGSVILLSHTPFGRRIYAVGNSLQVARLSGVKTSKVTIGAYILCGIMSALGGVFLAALSGQAFLAMGDPYLLSSIAVVLVGGTVVTGGRGHYLGMFGGCLLLTAIGTLFAGTTVSFAIRDVVFGGVILLTVLSLRDAAHG